MDRNTGVSRGYAYLEFTEDQAVELACGLNETEFKGQSIKVKRKRQNIPRFMLHGRGRGNKSFRGRIYRGNKFRTFTGTSRYNRY